MATSYSVCKDRNMIYFTNEDGKAWSFDVNTGIFLSPKGNAVKSFPTGLGSFIDGHDTRNDIPAVRLMAFVRNDPHDYGVRDEKNYYMLRNPSYYAKLAVLFQAIDKMASLGCSPDRWNATASNLTFINDHFKAFAKWYKDNQSNEIEEFVRRYGVEVYCREHNIDTEHLSADTISFIQFYLVKNKGIYGTKWSSPEYLPYVMYYLSRGLVDVVGVNVASNLLTTFFDWCETTDIKPQKSDFYRQYLDVKHTYIANKKQYDMIALANNYAEKKKALLFEDDTFKVIIPTTVEEFKAEGDAQHNCVYSMYLEKCIKNTTHVVFVRRKDALNESYITCEVDKRGNIVQYLGQYNNWVSDPDAITFKKRYMEWLANNW